MNMPRLTDAQYLQALTEETSEAILLAVVNKEEKAAVVVRCNDAAVFLFGRARKEILGHGISQLMPARYREGHFERMMARQTSKPGAMRGAREGVKNLVYGWNASKEKEFPIVADIGYPEYDGVLYVLARVQDDSERVALRDELIQEREALREQKERAEKMLAVWNELDSLKEAQQESLNKQQQNLAKTEITQKELAKFVGMVKFVAPIAIALLGALSDIGQETISYLGRARRNIGAEQVTEINPLTARSIPVVSARQASVVQVLEKYQGNADLALFGHYNSAAQTGQIDLQARRGDTKLATLEPWPIVGQQPFAARAQRHAEGSCYTIDGVNGVLESVAFQVSCPVTFENGSELVLGFVALEYKRGAVDETAVELRVKDLASVVQLVLNAENRSSGTTHAKEDRT